MSEREDLLNALKHAVWIIIATEDRPPEDVLACLEGHEEPPPHTCHLAAHTLSGSAGFHRLAEVWDY